MVTDVKQFELNRIVDMIKTRQYSVVSSSIQGDRIIVTAEKVVPAELQINKDLEATWMTNFLRSFGWVVQSSQFPEGKIIFEFAKTVEVKPPG